MKVLAISYGRHMFDEGNIERVRMQACAAETESLHMIVFTLMSDCHDVANAGTNLTIHPTNSRFKILMLWDAYCIGSKLSREKGEWVVTTQDPFETGIVGLLLARRYSKPFNVQEHGDVFSSSHWRKESIFNRVRFLIGKWILRHADTVRVVSKRMIATMGAIGVPDERIIELSVRTNIEDFISSISETDTHFGSGNTNITILTMARFVPQKNIQMLLEVFAGLHQQYPEVRLNLVGAGRCEQLLRKSVKDNNLMNVVTFIPWVANPVTLMQQADVYALTSNYEGWGRVLIEAMQVGLPIITTDVGCAKEVVLHGRHGFVVPVGDLKMYKQKLARLVSDAALRKKFGLQGQKDVQQYSEDVSEYARRWIAVLKSTRKNKISGETPSEDLS